MALGHDEKEGVRKGGEMKRVSVAEFLASRGKKKATRKPRTNKRPEASLKRSLVAKLTALGFWCWVNNSGVMVVESKGKRRIIKLSPKGSPDVFVIGASGRLCGIECKAPEKKQSASQAAWEKKAETFGVGYAMAWTVDDAVKAASEWLIIFSR